MKIASNESFEVLFKPVIEGLSNRSWLALPSSFEYPSAWLDRGYDEATNSFVSGPVFEFEHECPKLQDGRNYLGHHLKPGVVSRFAAGVSNDWSTLMAMKEPVLDGLPLLKAYFSSANRMAFVEDRVAAFIQSVDGIHWQVYVVDAELRERLRLHLASLKEPEVTEVPWPEAYVL